MSRPELSAEFVETSHGRLFVVTHGRRSSVGSCTLIVAPFGDEMNKSRHLLAQTARGLAQAGQVAVLPDVYGTGDSDGEFAEASWEIWLENLQAVGRWLVAQGLVPNAVLAVRTGALLGLEAAAAAAWPIQRVVLWQPVTHGARFLTQFLRLRVAATLTAERRDSVDGLRQRLAAGEGLDVAGYVLSPPLAAALDRRELGPLIASLRGSLHWFEVVAGGEGLTPATAAAVAASRTETVAVQAAAICGQPYWSSSEIVQVPELVAATVAALSAAA